MRFKTVTVTLPERVWGHLASIADVLPANAGVILSAGRIGVRVLSAPRQRGGDPKPRRNLRSAKACSPPTRG